MRRTSTRRTPTHDNAIVQAMGDHAMRRCELAYFTALLVAYSMFAATTLWLLFQ